MKNTLLTKGRSLMAAGLIAAMVLTGVSPAMAALSGNHTNFEEKRGERAASPGEAEGSEDESASFEHGDGVKPKPATEINVEPAPASPSVALYAYSASSLGDIWDGWAGDLTFLNGQTGDGSKEAPYQIKNRNQLMGLSQLAAMGMSGRDGEIVADYKGKYFELTGSIDLGGMKWNPIGFYGDSSELSGDVVNKFSGYFNGNGKTVSNFTIANDTWSNVGFFGAIEEAVVENLILEPGKTVSAKNNAAILAGSMIDSRIVNCTVSGNVRAKGNVGGMTADADGSSKNRSVIENCEARVTLDADGGTLMYVGGIAGKAARTSIVDCKVTTGDKATARIQGKGVVGGIAGFQNGADIYNCYVSGIVGGTGAKSAGGITGQYGSGHMKVVRFEGIIGSHGLGSSGHRGIFIGNREAGNFFTYGEGADKDVAYLFSDSAESIAFNVCGSEIPDDNEYTYAAHVGYSHGGDLYYSLVQGGKSKESRDTYYYEELENGILSIMDKDNGGEDAETLGYELDHFASNDAGRPTRGYIISIPQINTVSGGINDYDVAVLEAKGNSGYSHTIDKEHRGAVAPGKSVTVTTSPKNTDEAKYQMEGVPTYTKGGTERGTAYVNGGNYAFTMPAENTEVKAVYKKVAVKITVNPSAYNITVVEERSGNRKNPIKTTKVLNHEGKLIATYISGILEQDTQVQPVNIQAVVDANNDVADSSVKWSVDDPELISLAVNDEEDIGGYTRKSASIGVNLGASFFTDTIRKLEKEQADRNYQYPIPDTIYGSGHQNGGVAILTAATRPAGSFEGKPCTGNCKINVTFQIKDKTYVANEEASLDKPALTFTITRKLTGNRKAPVETVQVTPPQSLSAAFNPDFFDKKDITWKSSDEALFTVKGEDKAAVIFARDGAKWIQDIMASDDGIHANNPYEALKGSGSRTGKVTVIADDMLGNRQTADCDVSIQFVTVDQTSIYAESVDVSPSVYSYDISCIKSGKRNNPEITWVGTDGMKLTASVLPEQTFNKTVGWRVSDNALEVDSAGNVVVNTNAEWIQNINRAYPYSGEHTSLVEAVSEDGGFKAVCSVRMTYRLTDRTTSGGSSSGGSSSGGGGGGGGGGSSTGVGPSGGVGPAGNSPLASAALTGSVIGTWVNTADGKWAFTAGGRTYNNEWAFIHNPYAGKDQQNTDWFRLDATGHLVVGWFTDSDGNRYYLSPVSDGTLGHMVTGWKWIAGVNGVSKRYYFNTLSDGTKGALLLNATAPDGASVNDKGEWTENGIVQIQTADTVQQTEG